jgi:hypothetical protein
MPQSRSIRFFDTNNGYAGAINRVISLLPQQYQGQGNATGYFGAVTRFLTQQPLQYTGQADLRVANNSTCRDVESRDRDSNESRPDNGNPIAAVAYAVKDDYAANTSTLGSLVLGTAKSGSLESRGDHDWFRISLKAGQTYQFLLKGVTLFDSYLYLRNSAGSVIASDDDGGGGNNSLITFTATTSGTYFLDAASYANRYTGTYTLLATTQSAPPVSTYSLTESAASINEGSTLTSTVTTTGVAAGTTLYWSLSGSGVDSADFSAGALTGSGVVGADGKFTFSHIAANDQKTEGDETAQIKLFTDASRTLQVGTTATVLIKDTSVGSTPPTPPPSPTGFKLNLVYDAAAMAAPASFRAAIERAAAIVQAAFTDNITVNLTVDISGTGGFAYAGPSAGRLIDYSTVSSLLKSRASAGDTSFNALPMSTSIQGKSSVAVWNAELKALGMLSANDTTTNDGLMGFATDINPNLIVGVALHEITHAMGRVPNGPDPGLFDLFRFTAPGVRLFEGSVPASGPSYFSIDNGVTKLADYGVNSDPSDFLNTGVQGSNDAFNEYYSPTTTQDLSSIDLKQMDVLGYHLSGSTVVASSVTGSPMISQSGAGSPQNPNFGAFSTTAKADLLTGTALSDTFSFMTEPNFTADGYGSDLITDFNGSQGDLLAISKSAFGLTSLASTFFQQVETAAALTACLTTSTQFVYDHSTGNLFYNQNGCASGFGGGGVFAVLQNQSSLTATNFQFV